jgi:hypothetical protein
MASGRKSKAFGFFKKYHKWVSLVLALFIIVFAISGIILNHRSWLSGVDVDRKFLPEVYRYNNWNLAALKGSIKVGADSALVYGNIGAWISTDHFKTFADFNQGFPDGIDNRKISKVVEAPDGRLFAASFFGLYSRNGMSGSWEKISLPVAEERIVDLSVEAGNLCILTRSNLLTASLSDEKLLPLVKTLPPPVNDDKKASLFRTLWVIHSGEIYGTIGKLFVDFVGIVFIFLTITGLLYFLFPKIIRFRKKRDLKVKRLAVATKFSLKWHNKIGWWLAAVLILTTLTGMFLRPPLLIPIANAKVGRIPLSELDSENPWDDKLRGMFLDQEAGMFILNTSDGFYFSGKDLEMPFMPFEAQPPVSVMGINVFEKIGKDTYLVGSFSGLFKWLPRQNYYEDFITGSSPVVTGRSGSPISENAVAGFLKDEDNRSYFFDYGRGAGPLFHSKPFTEMPAKIIENSPMSLWNMALEFHTARIYSVLIGDFYILIIPLAGLSILFILISGLYLYWGAYRKKRPTKLKPAKSINIAEEPTAVTGIL